LQNDLLQKSGKKTAPAIFRLFSGQSVPIRTDLEKEESCLCNFPTYNRKTLANSHFCIRFFCCFLQRFDASLRSPFFCSVPQDEVYSANGEEYVLVVQDVML
jgi:hypothetical protein